MSVAEECLNWPTVVRQADLKYVSTDLIEAQLATLLAFSYKHVCFISPSCLLISLLFPEHTIFSLKFAFSSKTTKRTKLLSHSLKYMSFVVNRLL